MHAVISHTRIITGTHYETRMISQTRVLTLHHLEYCKFYSSSINNTDSLKNSYSHAINFNDNSPAQYGNNYQKTIDVTEITQE